MLSLKDCFNTKNVLLCLSVLSDFGGLQSVSEFSSSFLDVIPAAYLNRFQNDLCWYAG